MFVKFSTSKRKDKKYTAQFFDDDGDIIKTVHFGQSGASDMTQHGNEDRKKLYLLRHKKNENWNDYQRRGGLARWILWNKPTLEASINDYVKRFKLKLKK